jgi:type II secretory pathway pseudopilin PulG
MNLVIDALSVLTILGGLALLVISPLVKKRRRADIQAIQSQLEVRGRLISDMRDRLSRS